MTRYAIGPMLLTAGLLALPPLAFGAAGDSTSNPPSTTHTTTTTTTTPASPGMASRPAATSPSASAQSAKKVPMYTTADGQIRVSKVVGASVYNDQNQSIGSIDDVLMGSDHKANTAVLSIGGFLGMGSKLVSVPIDQLKVTDDRIVMPGATKASLEGMPDYKYQAS